MLNVWGFCCTQRACLDSCTADLPSPAHTVYLSMGWQEAVAFLLSPEAVELRPLLVTELVTGLDLAARDRARRLSAQLRPEVRGHTQSYQWWLA